MKDEEIMDKRKVLTLGNEEIKEMREPREQREQREPKDGNSGKSQMKTQSKVDEVKGQAEWAGERGVWGVLSEGQ